MRDLKKHPITTDEMHDAITRVADTLTSEQPERYGDITIAALRAAAHLIRRAQFVVEPQ